MNSITCTRVKELYRIYLRSFDILGEPGAMVGCREVKRLFGFLYHACPVCETNMRYFNIISKAPILNPDGSKLRSRVLPLFTKKITPLVIDSQKLWLYGPLQLGVCTTGHEIARIKVRNISKDGKITEGYLIHRFAYGSLVFISCPRKQEEASHEKKGGSL